MIEDLLADLSRDGWTVSWAFQFALDHWRVSIIKSDSFLGVDQPAASLSHCADAPTFAEALEDAMCRRNDAEVIPGTTTNHSIEKPMALSDLLKALPSIKSRPIDRRI